MSNSVSIGVPLGAHAAFKKEAGARAGVLIDSSIGVAVYKTDQPPSQRLSATIQHHPANMLLDLPSGQVVVKSVEDAIVNLIPTVK